MTDTTRRRCSGSKNLIFLPCMLLSSFGFLLFPCKVPAAETFKPYPIDPRLFGFEIPPGPITTPQDQRVVTIDEDGASVVARVHVRVGATPIVMLPDGQLVARDPNATTPTERPFEPATKDAIAEKLTSPQFKGFKTNQTRHYLYVYNTSEPFALATSRIMETMFPGVVTYAQAQKIDVHPPPVPMVVIMFRTEDEFQRYRRMPAGIVAYYNPLTNRVVMYEESKLAKVKPELAIQQSLATIAHEGAHQILNNIGVQQRLSVWPMWLGEGLAEFFAPTSTDKRLKWIGAGQVNDMRMFELEQYLKGHTAENASGKMVEHTALAAQLTSTGYATAWALTHYLAKNRRVEFHEFVQQISRTPPLHGSGRVVEPGVVPANVTLFKQHFGDDLAEMEKRLILHLHKLPYNAPFAEWPHFVAMLLIPNGKGIAREANVFYSEELANKWRHDTLAKVGPEFRASVQSNIREFPNRLVAEQFARRWLAGE